MIRWLQFIHRAVQPSPQLLGHFRFLREKPCTHGSQCISLELSMSRQLLICFLSLSIYLFWTCHINRIVQYVVFCGWLLKLGTMFHHVLNVNRSPSPGPVFGAWTGGDCMFTSPWYWGLLWEASGGEPVGVKGVLLICPVGPALFSAPLAAFALALQGFSCQAA